MSTNMEDQDRLESHAVDNVLNDDEHNLAEEKADYKIGMISFQHLRCTRVC